MSDLAEKLKQKLCNKLPSEFKKKLVTALRSNKFKQCDGTMFELDEKGRDRYCVMGVVHKLVYPDRQPRGGSIAGSEYVKDGKVPSVFLDGSHGFSSKIQEDLIEKNDYGWSFKKLATWINKNL